MSFEKLKKCLEELVGKYNTPGVDCLVCKEHEQIFRYYTGLSDIENNIKMNGNEGYLIFSMTKMITCTAALQLFEKGIYNMEDSVSKYLPEFRQMKIAENAINTNDMEIASGRSLGENIVHDEWKYAKNDIKIKDLFTMQAGLDYNLSADGIKKAIERGRTSTRELVSAISETVLGFEPGTGFRYSLCHDVIGALIEIWSGKRFSKYLEENIFIPLGMKNTFFDVPQDEEHLSKMAARYIFEKDGHPKRLSLVCGFNLSDDYESGGAGLSSTTEDYALFLDALACGGVGKSGNRILKKETVDLMGRNYLAGKSLEDFEKIRPGYGYGLGVRVHIDKDKSKSLSPIGEFGWDGAAGAFSMVDTENKISLTYFQHVHNWDIDIQNKLRNAFYSEYE